MIYICVTKANNMTTSEKYSISLSRLDYKNTTERGGFKMLPRISSFEEMEDINEIESITIGYPSSKEEMEVLRSKFPKSYKAGLIQGFNSFPNGSTDFSVPVYGVYFRFNTFFLNEVTKERNESAIARRLKIINKIKEIIK